MSFINPGPGFDNELVIWVRCVGAVDVVLNRSYQKVLKTNQWATLLFSGWHASLLAPTHTVVYFGSITHTLSSKVQQSTAENSPQRKANSSYSSNICYNCADAEVVTDRKAPKTTYINIYTNSWKSLSACFIKSYKSDPLFLCRPTG